MLDHALADIGLGVRWLREQGVERLVLLGNSGGGSLMAAYQARAAQDARGDLYISLAAHPGRPQVLTAWMDASVTDEFDPTQTDASLDIFNADNGPPYAPEFVSRYREAQVARNRRITAWAKRNSSASAQPGSATVCSHSSGPGPTRGWSILRSTRPTGPRPRATSGTRRARTAACLGSGS